MWTECDEGADTWSAFDVTGQLVHGEKTDWIPRTKIILSETDDRCFVDNSPGLRHRSDDG